MIPPQLRNQRFIRVKDKQPVDQNWQREVGGTNFTIEDKDFLRYLEQTRQYGVLCGYNNLIVIDFDNEDVQKEVLESEVLPKTFSVKTARKGLLHLYFYTDNASSWKVLTKDKETLADVQGKAKQVIGPGSRIPDGREYVVFDDLPIATVSATDIHRALDKFDYARNQEVLQQVSDGLTLSDFEKKFDDDKALAEVRRRLKISDILKDRGISTSRNPTQCPFHSSKGGKCLGFDDSKGIWNCFHCMEKGTAIDLWMKVHNVSDFVDAKKQLCEEFGIEDTYVADKAREASTPTNSLPLVKLPQDNYTLAMFATDIAQYFKGDDKIFFKPDEDNIVEIKEYEDKLLKRLVVGFKVVDPKRLVNIIETKVNTYNTVKVKKDEVAVLKTPNEQTIKLLSANADFTNALYPIKRFLNYPIPFLTSDGELIVPRHVVGKGYYDERFQAYFTPETPELKLMSVSEAKIVLLDILSEFCFKDELDKVMALSYIITPMCRGLYNKPTTRTPIYIISANRERAGKDYLAGVRGILYEGQAIDDTPIVTGDKSESNNEELRKKLTAALKSGRRLFHSSNNRGFLNNAVLEQFSTSEIWRDRELGRNTQLELNNEVDISLSANLGLTYTPDLHHRSRPIHLFYTQEDPNERKYRRTDLHGYVRKHRALVLSAIYSLINSWITAGQPESPTPFTSFPEWARVVGGIMHHIGFGDPCTSVEDTNIGGDKETQSMKELCGFMGIYQLNDATQPVGYKIGDLRHIVIEAHSSEEMEGFSAWDFTDKSVQTKFGILIKRFVGREFHCKHGDVTFKVQMVVAKDNDRSNKILYSFPVEVEKDKSLKPEESTTRKVEEEVVQSTPTIIVPPPLQPELPPEQPLNFSDAEEVLISTCLGKDSVDIQVLVDRGISDEMILEFIKRGAIFEVKPGYVALLK